MLYIMPPRMSSHCYKLFDLFSFDFSHKTVVLERRTLYCCHKISGEDVTSLLQVHIVEDVTLLLQNQVKCFPLHLHPSIIIHIYSHPHTFQASPRVSFSYPRYSIICSIGIFFFSKISFSPQISSSSSKKTLFTDKLLKPYHKDKPVPFCILKALLPLFWKLLQEKRFYVLP